LKPTVFPVKLLSDSIVPSCAFPVAAIVTQLFLIKDEFYENAVRKDLT
jgi:hypothetical protein